ncbi:PIG-L deacetylase family protein [Propionibacteriaceae bacterium Y2011]|uniref:PIG-L deacetylase family protein n=1 Tax=Microlunatus sp. Y2014 TaxID=3418488 RepID=UPI003B442E10
MDDTGAGHDTAPDNSPAAKRQPPDDSAPVTPGASLVLSPHQDDEINRVAALVARESDRGTALRLVNATDGCATAVRTKLALSYEQTRRWRDREQASAWSWLTDDRSPRPINLGFPDGALVADALLPAVERELQALADATGTTPRLYVATWHPDRPDTVVADRHPDHVACHRVACRLRDALGLEVRFGRHVTAARPTGEVVLPDEHQRLRIEGAIASYTVIGNRSVRTTFEAILAGGGRSVLTE